MPFVAPDDQVGFRPDVTEPPAAPPTGDVVGAAFRQDNTVVSTLNAIRNSGHFEADPNHNPLTIIRDTPYEASHLDRFVGSRSEAETRAIMGEIDREDADNRVLDAAGIGGTMLRMLAGTFDPTMLLPAGTVVKAGREGYSLARSAAVIGLAAAGQSAAQESILQSTQQTRSLAESGMAIGSATILGSLLGAGAARLLSSVDRKALSVALDAERAQMDAHASGKTVDVFHGTRADFDKFDISKLGEETGTADARQAFFFTSDPNLAAQYSRGFDNYAETRLGRVLNSVTRGWYERVNEGFLSIFGVSAGDRGFVKRVRLRLENPMEIDLKGGEWDEGTFSAALDKAKAAGHDSVIFRNVDDTIEGEARLRSDIYTVFHPDSATILGTRRSERGQIVGDERLTEAGMRARAASGQPQARAEPPVANDNAGRPAMAASAGAAAADTRRLELAPALGAEKLKIDPMSRLLNSESITARRTAVDLAETPLMMKENFEGIPTTQGASLEREARLAINSTRVEVGDELDRLFSESRFGEQVTVPRMRAQFERVLGRDGSYMTHADFKREVAKALQEGDRHDIPQVEQAAQFIRRRVFEPWKERAIKAGLLPEDVGVKTAESFFQRVYDRPKISAQRPQFVDAITDWLRSDQATKQTQKQELEWRNAQLKSWSGQVSKFEARLQRLDAAQAKVGARLDERAMEVRRAETRADVLKERETDIADELTDIESFIRETRQDLHDPALLARLDQMEKEAAELRRAERPVTEADLRKVEDQEVKGILTGQLRTAAEMVVGRRAYPKAPSFITWLVANGGVKDTTGDIGHIMGGSRSRPGLINSQGRTLHNIGERIKDEAPGHFDTPPDENTIAGWIDEALRGREPSWWIETRSADTKENIAAGKLATALEEMLGRAGVEVKSVRDVGRFLRDGRMGDVTLADLDRIAADMEAAGETIPMSVKRAEADQRLEAGRDEIRQIRVALADAMAAHDAANQRFGKATAVTDEAAFGARQNRGRLGVLQDRLDRGEMRRELIADAIEIANRQRDELRAKIEETLGAWEGKSAAEAKSALKSREAYRAEKVAEGKAPEGRLTGADDAVDRAVKRIIASDRELPDEDLRARAHEIVDRILSSPDGRLPYDIAMGGPKIGAFGGDQARGSLAPRDFNIPDAIIRPWLDQDVERVVGTHLRTMVPDVLLTEKFGDVDLQMPMRAINEEYAALTDAAKTEKERTRLEKERQRAIGDLAAVRDRIRQVYGYSPDPFLRNAARTAAAIKNYNVLSTMGSATVSSLADMAGPIFRNGLEATFRDGWVPFFKSLVGDGEAWKAAKRQYRAMGIVTETALASRHHALDDINDLYHPESRLERTMQWGADRFQLANLLAPWTDWGKTTAATIAGAEILRAAEASVKGTVSAKQLANLAASGIDRQMADRIWRQFDPAGGIKAGAIQDGVYLPNTGDWRDLGARQAFEGAVGREADIAIITPGQEKPLWMSHPIMSVLGQFKSFTAASTQRVLIANLQRRDAAALQGLMFSLSLGMLSYKLNSLFSGNKTSDRPQDWVKEGVSRSGMLGWFEEGNALASKMSRGGVDVYRLIGADKPLSRYASRSVLDQLLGPTVGKIEALSKVGGAAVSLDWSASDTHALRRLTAFQNLFYVRRLFDAAESGLNGALGAPEKPH